jgi:hypothetical protein
MKGARVGNNLKFAPMGISPLSGPAGQSAKRRGRARLTGRAAGWWRSAMHG